MARLGTLLLTAALAACALAPDPFPYGAESIPTGFSPPGGLPATCAARAVFVTPSSLCPGETYFLCDGAIYVEYDCASPGAGWDVPDGGAPDGP